MGAMGATRELLSHHHHDDAFAMREVVSRMTRAWKGAKKCFFRVERVRIVGRGRVGG